MSRPRFKLLDFDLSPGFQVIEAGAGSGKTYNLVRIVLRLLTRTQNPLPIREILLVTFTEAAALEMRMRLRSILEEALRPNPKGDLAKIMAVPGSRRRLQRALDDLGSMQVTTIHGFCLRAYGDHAVNCGFPPFPGDPQDGSELAAEIAADWYRTQEELEVKLHAVEAATKALVMCPDAELDDDLEGLREYVARRLADAPMVTFDQLIGRLLMALRDSTKGLRLRGLLQKDYKACLIDESQDTDASQWEIFNTLFGPKAATEEHFLLMVGDPKQSIYGFRGADVKTYCSAIKQADKILTLPDNYRSAPRMVDAFNVLFSRDGFFATSEITYDEAGSGEGRIAELAGMPFEVVHSDEPAAVAREAMRLLREMDAAHLRKDGSVGTPGDGAEPAEVGILVRSNTEAAKIYRALVAAGQGASLESKQSVFETTTAFQVQLLLRAVLRPSHAGNRKALLLSRPSLFGEAAKLDDATDNAMARWLSQCLTIWRKQGFAPAWEALTRRSPGEGLLSVVEGLGRCQFRHRALMDLSHVGELLISRQRTLHWTPEQLFDHLTSRLRSEDDGELEESDASESESIRPDVANSRILVRTIHKSKGLEYNAVILAKAFSYRVTPPKKGAILRRGHEKSFVFTGDKDNPQGEVYERLLDQQREEDARLLYVALTRARHRFVWMGVSEAKPDQHGNIGEPGGFSEVLNDIHLDPSLRVETLPKEIKAFTAACVPLKADDPLSKPLPAVQFHPTLEMIPERLPMAYGATSYSGLTKGKHDSSSTASGFEDPDDPDDAVSLLLPDNLKGNLLGNLLHKLMELVDFHRAIADRPYLRELVERLLGGSGLIGPADPSFAATVEKLTDSTEIWLKQSLASHSGAPFRLADLDPATQLSEVRFSFAASIGSQTFPQLEAEFAREFGAAAQPDLAKLGLAWNRANELDGLVTGSVDFVFAHDGRYYVVDWKSNFIGENSADYLPERISRSIAKERYHLQFSLYTVALDAHLSRCLGKGWDYERDFGGVYYLYLRGFGTHPEGKHGAFFHRPSAGFVSKLRTILQTPVA
jgi:exodeoxyribonuclease V beta subunit